MRNITIRSAVTTLLVVGVCVFAFTKLKKPQVSRQDTEMSSLAMEEVIKEAPPRAPAQIAASPSSVPREQKANPQASVAATKVSPWDPSAAKQPMPQPLSRQEIERRRRERMEAIGRHLSEGFVTDKGANIHWLDDVVGVHPRENLPESTPVLFVYNDVAYVESGRASGVPGSFQAVYDPKRDRPGVVTNIVVIANDENLDPVALGRQMGLRHSSSRFETGIHFYDVPAGGASVVAGILSQLKNQPGVASASLGTRFETLRPM